MSESKSTTNPLREDSELGSQDRSRATQPSFRGPRPRPRPRPECKAVNDNGSICGETKTLSITDELKELYENRLKKLDEDTAGDSGQVQVKVNVLQNWVQDLLEQNAELVHTVEELEREMGYRVKCLEEKLVESARACRAYMAKLQDCNTELRNSAADKEELARKDELIKKLQAELEQLRSSASNDKDSEISKLKEHLGLKDDQIRTLIKRIQELREDINKKSSAVTKYMLNDATDGGTRTDEKTSTASPLSGSESISRSERRALSVTYDDDTERLQENLRIKKAELETQNGGLDSLRSELQAKDEIIRSLKARMQDRPIHQRDSASSQLSEHERKVDKLEESLKAAKIGMKKSFEEFKEARVKFECGTNVPDNSKLEEYERLLNKERAAIEAMKKEMDSLLQQIQEREKRISNQDKEMRSLNDQLISSQDAQMAASVQAEKYIKYLEKAEHQQYDSETRINELQNALQRTQDNMQASLKKLEQSNNSLKEAKDFHRKAEEGQEAFNKTKVEMDLLLNNLHSRESHIKELEAIIENLHISLEKTQKQLIQVQNNANEYLKERELAYRNEETAREKIASLQAQLEGTSMDVQRSWHELKVLGSRRISFAPPAMAFSDYETSFENEEAATDEMKEELHSLLKDLKDRDGEIANLAQTIKKLQAELLSTQNSLRESQRKEVSILGEKSRAQDESKAKILELEGTLRVARSETNQPQEFERRTHGVSFQTVAGPSNDSRFSERARSEINEISQTLEAREKHIKKQDAMINALQKALDEANDRLGNSGFIPDSSAARTQQENKQMKQAINDDETFLNQSFTSPKSYGKSSLKSKSSNKTLSSNMDEFRLNTVEAQAAVEDMMEEMEALMKNMKSRERQISELENMIVALQQNLAQYERETAQLRDKTEVIEREKITSELNLKEREKKIQELQEALNSAQINMKRSFEKLITSKQQADAQEYHAKAREGQLAMDKMTDEMKNVIRSVQSREKQLSTKEEIIRNLQRSLEQTRADVASIQKKASTYLKEKKHAEEKRKESERKLEKLQAELENAQDELRKKLEQFSSYQLESEVEVSSKILPITPRKSYVQPDFNEAQANQSSDRMRDEIESLVNELAVRDKQLASQEEMVNSLRKSLYESQKQVMANLSRKGLVRENMEMSFQYDKDAQISDLQLTLDRCRQENEELQNSLKALEIETSRKSVMFTAQSSHAQRNDTTDRELATALAQSRQEIQNLQDKIKVYELQVSQKPSNKMLIAPRRSVVHDAINYRGKDENAYKTLIENLKKEIDDLLAELARRDNQNAAQEEMVGLLRQQLARAQQKVIALQNPVNTYTNNLDQVMSDQVELQKLQNRLTSLEIDLKRARQHVAAQEETIRSQRQTISELESSLGQGTSSQQRVVEKSISRQDLETKLHQKNMQIKALEEEVNAIDNKLRQSAREASKLKLEFENAEERLVGGARNIEDIKAQLSDKDRQITAFMDELESLRNQLRKSQMDAVSLRQDLQTAKELEEIGRNKILALKDMQIDALEKEIKELRYNLQQCMTETANAKQNLQKAGEEERFSGKGKPTVDPEFKSQLEEKNLKINLLEDELNTLRNNLRQSKIDADILKQDIKLAEERSKLGGGGLLDAECIAKLREKDKQIDNLDEEISKLRSSLKHAKMELAEVKEDLEMTQQKPHSGKKCLADPEVQAKLLQKDNKIDALEEELNALRQSLKSSKFELTNLREELNMAQEMKITPGRTLDIVRSNGSGKCRDKDSRIEELLEELESLRNSIKKCKSELREKDSTIDNLETELSSLRRTLKNSNLELSNLKDDLQTIEGREKTSGKRSKDADLKRLLDEKCKEMNALEQELDIAQNAENNYKKEISRLKQDLKAHDDQKLSQRSVDNIKTKGRDKDSRIEELLAELESLRNGTKKYKSELHEKDNTIERLEAELSSLQRSLRNSNLELSNLKQDLETVEERGKMSGKSGKDADLKRLLNEKEQQIDALERDLDTARNAENNYKKEINRLKTNLKGFDDEVQMQHGTEDAALHRLRKHLEEKNKQIENQEEEMNLLRNTLNSYKREIAELKKALGDMERDIPELQRELAASEERFMSKGQAVGFLQGTLDTTQEELRKLQLEIERMLKEKDSSQTEIQGLQSELDNAKREGQRAKELMSTVEEQKKRLDKCQDELNRANAEIQSLQSALKAKEKLLADQEQMAAIQKDTIKRSQDEFNALKDKVEQLETKRKDCEKEKDQLNDEICSLQAQLKDNDKDSEQLRQLEQRNNQLQQELADNQQRSEKEIQQLLDNIAQLENLLAEAQAEAENAAWNNAANNDLENQIDSLQNENDYQLEEIQRLEDMLMDNQVQMDQLVKQHKALLNQHKEHEQTIGNLLGDVNNLTHELELSSVQLEAKQNEADDIRNMLDNLQGSHNVLEGLIQKKEAEMDALLNANGDLQDELNRMRDDKKVQDIQNINLTELLKDVEKKAKRAEDGYHKAIENDRKNQAALAEAANREKQMRQEFANNETDILDKLQMASSEAQELSNAVNMLNGEVENLQSELADRENHLLATENDLESLGQSLLKLKADAKNKNEAIKRLKENEDQYKMELEEKNAALEEMSAENDQLSLQLSNMHNTMENQLDYVRKENDANDTEKANLTYMLQDAQNKIDQLEKDYHKAVDNYKKTKAALFDAINQEAQLKQQFADMERKLLDQLQAADLKVLKKTKAIKELKAVEEQLAKELQETAAALQNRSAEVADLKSQLSNMHTNMKRELETLQNENRALNAENANLSDMLKAAVNEAKNSEKGYHKAMEASQRNQDTLIEAANREAQLEREFAEKEKALLDQVHVANLEAQQLSDAVQNKSEAINELNDRINQLASQVEQLESALESQTAEAANLKAQLIKMSHRIKELLTANSSLDSENVNLKEMLNQVEHKAQQSEMAYHKAMENTQSIQAALIEAASEKAQLQQEFADKEKHYLNQLGDASLEAQELSNQIHNKNETIKILKAMEKQSAIKIKEQETALTNQATEIASLESQLSQMSQQMKNKLLSLKNKSETLDSENVNLMEMLKDAEDEAKQSEMGYHEAMETSQRNQDALIEAANRQAQLQQDFAEKEKELLDQLKGANYQIERLSDDVHKRTEALLTMKAKDEELTSQLEEKDAALNNQYAEVDHLRLQLEQMQERLLHMQGASADQLTAMLQESAKLKSDITNLIHLQEKTNAEKLVLNNQISKLKYAAGEYKEQLAVSQQQLQESLEAQSLLKQTICDLEFEISNLSENLCKSAQVAEDFKYKGLCEQGERDQLLANQETLEHAKQLLEDRNATLESEKSILSQAMCKLSQDYQQQLNAILTLQETITILEDRNTQLANELAFLRNAFEDLHHNYLATSNSVASLKCKLSEATTSRKDELNDICMESRALVDNVRQWINQQISDNTKLCNLIKAKSAVNHKLSINMQNMLIKIKSLKEQNAILKQALNSFQGCPGDNVAPTPSCIEWPAAQASLGQLASSTAVSITHFFNNSGDLDQESTSPDESSLGSECRYSRPGRNCSVTWSTTMTGCVDPKTQNNRKRQRQVRSLTRS